MQYFELFAYLSLKYTCLFCVALCLFHVFFLRKKNLSIPFQIRGGDSSFSIMNQNGIPFSSKSKGKLLPRAHSIQFERKLKSILLSVHSIVFRVCIVYLHILCKYAMFVQQIKIFLSFAESISEGVRCIVRTDRFLTLAARPKKLPH